MQGLRNPADLLAAIDAEDRPLGHGDVYDLAFLGGQTIASDEAPNAGGELTTEDDAKAVHERRANAALDNPLRIWRAMGASVMERLCTTFDVDEPAVRQHLTAGLRDGLYYVLWSYTPERYREIGFVATGDSD